MPSRLLQIYLDPLGSDRTECIRLVHVDKAIAYSYVTLSYRWGRPEPLKVTRTEGLDLDGHKTISVQSLTKGIPVSKLPKTFREATQIAAHCGIEYLWIDCLCIIQDKTSDGYNQDWEDEAAKMGDIYAGGLL